MEMIDSFFPFSATTGPITVRVSVSYLPEQSHPALSRWFWAYHVRIENEGDAPVQLLTRRWSITCEMLLLCDSTIAALADGTGILAAMAGIQHHQRGRRGPRHGRAPLRGRRRADPCAPANRPVCGMSAASPRMRVE